MSLARFSRLLAALAFVSGGAALAQHRQLQSYQSDQMTQQERDALRSRPKYNVNEYGKDIKIKQDPIPWKAIALAVIAFSVAAPFAWRTYKRTTKEMSESNVFGVQRADAAEADPE